MRDYEQFKKESVTRFMTNLATHGINLTYEEQSTVEDLLINELSSARIHANLGFPRESKAKFKLVANEGIIIGYHPIKGSWHHIAQVITPQGKTLYYTDGIPEKVDGGLDEARRMG